MKRWISIKEAATKAKIPVWTMRRRLKAINKRAGGKLLRSDSDTGVIRKYQVNASVLDDLLLTERAARQGMSLREEIDSALRDVNEAHERIDVLDIRTQAHKKRLGEHGAQLKKHRKQITTQQKVITSLKTAMAAITEASEGLAELSSDR